MSEDSQHDETFNDVDSCGSAKTLSGSNANVVKVTK
jgi:hypothetical protein